MRLPSRHHPRGLLPLAVALCLGWNVSLATTICTYISDSAEHPLPRDQRQSIRSVQSQVFPKFIEGGDKAAANGRLAEAAFYYRRVFQPFQYRGLNYGPARCASPRIYREAHQKLRRVARAHATFLMSQGHYLQGESPVEVERLPSGALYLLLASNQYEAFIEHSLEYAASELRERDIDNTLLGMVSQRLKRLESTNNIAMAYERSNLINDLSPLLDEELQAPAKLADFAARLKAHLAPLYPPITDYWLGEEKNRYQTLLSLGNELEQSLFVNRAAGALSEGISRLRHHRLEVERLKQRGNLRGQAFMRTKQYQLAGSYFDAVDNDTQAAEAKALASQVAAARVSALKQTLESEMKSLKKSDEERAGFEADADDMAAEFGFDMNE